MWRPSRIRPPVLQDAAALAMNKEWRRRGEGLFFFPCPWERQQRQIKSSAAGSLKDSGAGGMTFPCPIGGIG